jgi:predicted amidophosphoribosyltransferase
MKVSDLAEISDELEARKDEIAEVVQADLDTKDDVNEPIELAVSILVHRDDGEIIGFDEADDLVEALNDRMMEFIEACDAVYCTAGSTKLIEKPVALFEVGEIMSAEQEVAPIATSKECTACHVDTTQMDANQCPLCGNPF